MRRLGAVRTHLASASAAPLVDPDVELMHKQFDIPSRRKQAEWRSKWIAERVNGILPGLMDENGVEFWVVSQKEYGEDTCWRALTPATQQAARRRSVIVFKRTADGVEQRIFVGFWESTWEEVREFLCSGGGDIAVNRSKTSAFADGMASGEFDAFEQVQPPPTSRREATVPRRALVGPPRRAMGAAILAASALSAAFDPIAGRRRRVHGARQIPRAPADTLLDASCSLDASTLPRRMRAVGESECLPPPAQGARGACAVQIQDAATPFLDGWDLEGVYDIVAYQEEHLMPGPWAGWLSTR
jgi:hypothetical protein